MANRRNIDRAKVPQAMLEKAREAALLKQARIMAEQELGIGDSDLPTQKGPPLEAEHDPKIDVYLNLPDFQDRISIDSVIYMHGRTYTLPQRVATVFKETMARAWRHQAEIEGKDRSNFYLQQQRLNSAINLGTGQRHQLPPQMAARLA